MGKTEDQIRKELILDNGNANKNYSIKAGAGGGKTTLLSKRISRQILNGVPIESFVIITYTNAAVEELREKIVKELNEHIASGKLNVVEKDNAQKALSFIEIMQISTIHSFLLKILKENAFASGIALDAKMLENDEDIQRREKYFNEYYKENYTRLTNLFGTRWNFYTLSKAPSKKPIISDKKREILFNMFIDMANIRDSIYQQSPLNNYDIVSYLDKWWTNLLDNFLKEINKQYQFFNQKKKTLYEQLIDVDNDINTHSLKNIEQAFKITEILKKFKSQTGNFFNKGGDESKLTQYIPQLSDDPLDWDFAVQIHSDAVKISVKEIEQLCREYQSEVLDKETKVLSNDDILFRAKKLLTDNPDILDLIRKKYSKIYVDEFQDTTGVQADIIKLISTKPGTNGELKDLSDDKLIMVGDPKQSIYRFTGAELAVYEDINTEINNIANNAGNSELINLQMNYRSNSKVVEWINTAFSKLMTNYSFMSTDWHVRDQRALHGVYEYQDQKGDGKNSDIEDNIKIIKEMTDNPKFFLEEYDRKSNTCKLRRIKYSDFMIITKTTTKHINYVEEFEKEGVPISLSGKINNSDNRVMLNFVLLIDFFANMKNKMRKNVALQLIRKLDISCQSKERLKAEEDELWKNISEIREKNLSPFGLAQYLLTKEEYYVPDDNDFKDIEAVKSYRKKIYQMVEKSVAGSNGDIGNLAELMHGFLNSEVKKEIDLENNKNAVKLMNVHQSKGLTGQIVIIADRRSKEECKYSGFRKSGTYYPSAWNKPSPASLPIYFPSYNEDTVIKSMDEADETEEAIRLQYVAATRAAQALIIMPELGNNRPWFSDERYPACEDLNTFIQKRKDDADEPSLVQTGNTVATTQNSVVLNRQMLEENKAQKDISQKGSRVLSVTPSALEGSSEIRKMTKEAKSEGRNSNETVTNAAENNKDVSEENRPSGNVFGTVMHRVYELVAVRFDSLKKCTMDERRKAISFIINQAIYENESELHQDDDPKEFKRYLVSVMDKYFDSVISPMLSNAVGAEFYPEYTFSFYVSDAERSDFLSKMGTDIDKHILKKKKDKSTDQNVDGTAAEEKNKADSDEYPDRIWINGQADLVVKTGEDSYIVYDYKSDTFKEKPDYNLKDFEEHLKNKYSGQLKLYKYAVAKSFGVSEDKVETELIHLYR